MRYFLDRSTSVRRAELILWVTDMLLLVGAAFWVMTPKSTFAAASVACWAMIPRSVSYLVSRRRWPSAPVRSVGLAALLVGGIGGLALVGWEVLIDSQPDLATARIGTAVILLFAWTSGFLLFFPPAYRLHEFLIGGLLLLGVVEDRPDALYFLPPLAFGLLFSAAVRHQLYDQGARRAGRVNLQNAWRLAVAVLAFAAVIHLVAGEAAAPFDATPRAEDGDAEDGAGTPEDGPERGGTGATTTVDDGEAQPGRPIFFSLSDLTASRDDQRPALTVRSAAFDDPSERALLIKRLSHWRGLAFDTYNPGRSAWVTARDLSPVATGGRSVTRRHPVWLRDRSPGRVRLDVRVELRVFDTLVAPYVTTRWSGTPPWTTAGTLYANRVGDVFAQPPIPLQGGYGLDVEPVIVSDALIPERSRARTHRDPLYLGYPPASEVGFDLDAAALRIMNGARTVAERVRRLREHFAASFTYNDRAEWSRDSDALARFFNEVHEGDCTYFSTTTALLLRAAGVSTRVIGGYLEGEWDGERNALVIRQSTAHAWVEVWFPEQGWIPVDPTGWVPGNRRAATEEEETLGDGVVAEVEEGPSWLLVVLAVSAVVASLISGRRERREAAAERPLRPTLVPPVTDVTLEPGSPAEEVLVSYHSLQKRLALVRRQRRPGETPFEHARRLSVIDAEAATLLGRIGGRVYGVLYASREATKDEAHEFLGWCRGVLKRLR